MLQPSEMAPQSLLCAAQVVGVQVELHAGLHLSANASVALLVPSGTSCDGASAQKLGVIGAGQPPDDQPVTRMASVVPGCTPAQLGACARKKATSASLVAMALSTARQPPQNDPTPPSPTELPLAST